MKMYIAVLDEVPSHMVPVLVAHTVLGAHLHIGDSGSNKDYAHYRQWLSSSFRKVVIRVNRKEFDKISNLENTFYLGHESTTLGGNKSCAISLVDTEIPNVLKFAKLWSPNESN